MENFKRLLKELKGLRLNREDFAIFGSGPIVIRGLRKGQDLDIIVKERLWNKLKKKYPINQERYVNPFIEIGKIEVWKDWKPWFKDSDKLIDRADIIEGIRFVDLKSVLKWKKAFGREKDLKDIVLIEKYLKKNS